MRRAGERKRAGHCIKCGIFRKVLQRDHVIPLWFDGIDHESNIQYLCANCHEDKTQEERKMPEYKAIVNKGVRGPRKTRWRLSQNTRAKMCVGQQRRRREEQDRALSG